MKNIKDIQELLYPLWVIGKDYVDKNNLYSKIEEILKNGNYIEIFTNGKIFETLEKNIIIEKFKEDDDYYFECGKLNDVNFNVLKFMRWDDKRVFFRNKDNNLFILNII